jgi:hypothetical protein
MKTPESVLSALASRPGDLLLRSWNWKAALYSSLIRALLFFVVNLGAGLTSAYGAMATEFVYRAATAGFYGALTQSFRKVEPWWHGTIAALGVLMAASHTIEFAIHSLRGTPHLFASVAASACLTLISTLFNLHAMRRGVFVTDPEARTLADDLRRLPGVLFSFVFAPRQEATEEL